MYTEHSEGQSQGGREGGEDAPPLQQLTAHDPRRSLFFLELVSNTQLKTVNSPGRYYMASSNQSRVPHVRDAEEVSVFAVKFVLKYKFHENQCHKLVLPPQVDDEGHVHDAGRKPRRALL
ncbi:hypothetical protein E2C01_036762 [Portunus trituberculatus]|uniref:Uncharacterized protein n=1 Tax=Portunus trituberculatus TaxID=210409 RepID=A0A5B7FC89_PORTR|nr:hypothetical protein [Portunus trituberculatus]